MPYFCGPSPVEARTVCSNLAQAGRLNLIGEVAEWLKEHAWKVCIVETLSRVRIPPSPLKSVILDSKALIILYYFNDKLFDHIYLNIAIC